MKKVSNKYFQLNKMNVSKLNTETKNAILGGNPPFSRTTVDFNTRNNC
ncbi:class I lanthipeptide [uncultured Kordia sp.]|nr:class I lanthipeptide [uncultured Kordia sp.]